MTTENAELSYWDVFCAAIKAAAVEIAKCAAKIVAPAPPPPAEPVEADPPF